jgi:hypothetical protein
MRIHLVLAGLFLIACSSSSSTRTVTGRVTSGVPDHVTTVKLLQGTMVVATAPVASDGSFRLDAPLGANYTMRFVGTGHTTLVMPRKSGGMQQIFMLAAGGDVALGNIHFIGSASTTRFSFHTDPATECDDDDHDMTGATCVDDEDGGDQCDGDEDHDGDGEGHDDFTAATPTDQTGTTEDDNDGQDDGDDVPDHDMDEGCMGSGSGSGSGGTGTGSGSGMGSGSGGTV